MTPIAQQKKTEKWWNELLAADYSAPNYERVGDSAIAVNDDCFKWLRRIPDNTIDAVVTDPPYGVVEFEDDQLNKMKKGKGGIWRIPPSFDGNKRAPLPRFTALKPHELTKVTDFFTEFGLLLGQKLKPGAHVFVASNSFLSQIVFAAIGNGNLEFRGEIIRMVRTLRGGDRPKNFEKEFPDVCSLPRGCYEPWGLFRKRIPSNLTVGACLRKYGTGGLRRVDANKPFEDVIESGRTSKRERDIAEHPSLKPQEFLRKIVHASLPLGTGIIVDPFMGSGSTVAASLAIGYRAIGFERRSDYFKLALNAIPKLSKLELRHSRESEDDHPEPVVKKDNVLKLF